MSPIYAIAGFWVAFVFLILGYLFRNKKLKDLFYQICLAATFISVIIFIWWAVLRAIGAVK